MIDTEPTTLELGTTGNVWARITDRLEQDLTAATIEIRTVAPDGTTSAWAAPADRDNTLAATGVVRVALLHVAAVVGYWKLQVRVTDNPETIVETADGGFRVV